MTKTIASYATTAPTEPLAPFSIERRAPDAEDVCIDILYCGICHTDVHMAHNDWGTTVYPLVPGHEIVGRVSDVGSSVSKFAQGDLVAVGCMVDSCRSCQPFENNLEQYCEKGAVMTSNSVDARHGKQVTRGGYSQHIVVNQGYVLRVPDNLDPAGAAPLLCAGITTWSPLKHWNVGPGKTVGVIGLGGLGHLGVKFAHALGARVVMITTSAEKGKDAQRLGADEVLLSTDGEAMKTNQAQFDFLLDTVPVAHPLDPYIALLKLDGTLAMVGVLEQMEGFHAAQLARKRRIVTSSLIGGIRETQEMLDFCAEHNVLSDIELIDIQDINSAYDRMMNNDVKYRFVIDMATLKG